MKQDIGAKGIEINLATGSADRAHLQARQAAEEAVRTLINWIGDDPNRPGLLDTPGRVVKAFEEWGAGYREPTEKTLERQFNETDGYHRPIELLNIPFYSLCEHHMAPFKGLAHIAYIPEGQVVGISKLARLVAARSRRLQIQERLTQELADQISRDLSPKGVAVAIEAEHACMTSRGVMAHSARMRTHAFSGKYACEEALSFDFLRRSFEN